MKKVLGYKDKKYSNSKEDFKKGGQKEPKYDYEPDGTQIPKS